MKKAALFFVAAIVAIVIIIVGRQFLTTHQEEKESDSHTTEISSLVTSAASSETNRTADDSSIGATESVSTGYLNWNHGGNVQKGNLLYYLDMDRRIWQYDLTKKEGEIVYPNENQNNVTNLNLVGDRLYATVYSSNEIDGEWQLVNIVGDPNFTPISLEKSSYMPFTLFTLNENAYYIRDSGANGEQKIFTKINLPSGAVEDVPVLGDSVYECDFDDTYLYVMGASEIQRMSYENANLESMTLPEDFSISYMQDGVIYGGRLNENMVYDAPLALSFDGTEKAVAPLSGISQFIPYQDGYVGMQQQKSGNSNLIYFKSDGQIVKTFASEIPGAMDHFIGFSTFGDSIFYYEQIFSDATNPVYIDQNGNAYVLPIAE